MLINTLFFFSDWARQPLQRQSSTNNNTTNMNAINNSLNKLNSSITNGDNFTIDVYLGGSCRTGVQWREVLAVPLLKEHGLTYYNPAIREVNITEAENNLSKKYKNGSVCYNGSNSYESSILSWKKVMDKCNVLLFVITEDTRSLTSMILAAHYIGLDKNVVLCVKSLPLEELVIEDEKVCM